MRAYQRFVAYGVMGWGVEVCFTAVAGVVRGEGDRRLRGESYVWMAPVYAVGGLVGEAVGRVLRRRPVWQRAAAYAVTFWAVEATSGGVLRRTIGDVPWGEEYRRHPDQLGDGLIRLSYALYWPVAGLALEQVGPRLERLGGRPPARSAPGGDDG